MAQRRRPSRQRTRRMPPASSAAWQRMLGCNKSCKAKGLIERKNTIETTLFGPQLPIQSEKSRFEPIQRGVFLPEHRFLIHWNEPHLAVRRALLAEASCTASQDVRRLEKASLSTPPARAACVDCYDDALWGWRWADALVLQQMPWCCITGGPGLHGPLVVPRRRPAGGRDGRFRRARFRFRRARFRLHG